MTGMLPLLLSDTNYQLRVPLDDKVYTFEFRWNSRDAAHYMNIYDDQGQAVTLGIKLVLGVNLARRCLHPLMTRFIFSVVDTEGSGVDAAFDDLGRRVRFQVTDIFDIAALGPEESRT